MRYVKWGFLIVVLAVIAAFLHYTLPRTDIVRITGTDVIRVDTSGWNGMFYAGADGGNTLQVNRDVRFINAVDEDRRPRVFRNQDTGWGWPPYFKFDSGSLQAEANDYDGDVVQEWVAVRHYGWRFEPLSIYPNALSIRAVAGPEATVIPWTSIVVLTLLAALAWAVAARVIRFRRNRRAPAAGTTEPRGLRAWFRRRRDG